MTPTRKRLTATAVGAAALIGGATLLYQEMQPDAEPIFVDGFEAMNPSFTGWGASDPGTWLAVHIPRSGTIWLGYTDTDGTKRIQRGTFHPELTLPPARAEERYGVGPNQHIFGSLTSERCTGFGTPVGDGGQGGPYCIAHLMGVPPEYRLSLQDSGDLAYVAAPYGSKNACDFFSAAVAASECGG